MNNAKKLYIFIPVIIVFVIAIFFYIENYKNKHDNIVEAVSNIEMDAEEKEGLLISVDDYMNKYRLPKGGQNSYKVMIEERLNDSIKITINPEDESWDSKTIIYARKINNTWEVDSQAGPWCSLQEFDLGEC